MDFRRNKIAWTFHKNTCRWRHNTLSEPDSENAIPAFKEYPDAKQIALPSPNIGEFTLKAAIEARYSCREYQQYKLPISDLSTILNYSYGVLNKTLFDKTEFFERPVPSGGGLYSLELYVLANNVENVNQGVYHFNINTPSYLEQIEEKELSSHFISQLFMNQYYLENCSCIVIISSFAERNMWKYEDRGYRYILFEAGHVAQNINLLTQALALSSLNLGGFFDQEVSNLLKTDQNEEIPLYAIVIGKAKSEGKNRLPNGSEY